MQVADALAHAASQGILHRDIKPSNLLLEETGNVWVTDFGLAKADDGDNLTHTGDIVGTLRYMAPERFNGQGDLRSDVYSLGLTLYELLALRPAFDETDRNKLVKQVMHDEPVRPRKLNQAVPRDLETVVLKAIARDPAHRYQTPAEMADDLKRFVEDRPVRARRISSAEKLWRWCRRNPLVSGMAAAVVLALTTGTTVSYLKYREAETARAAVEARCETAQRALALFHTGVSEDFLLKKIEFTALRTKLLKEAAGFYAELEKLLAGKTDARSRKLLAEGYFQLGDLTAKIGDWKEALVVQRKALALRRELAAAPGADVETRLEVARSLGVVALLLRSAGGHTAEALSAYEEQRDLAAALEAKSSTDAVRTQLASGHHGIGLILYDTGKRTEALKEHQKAVAILQKLADANPAATEIQSDLAESHNHIGIVLDDTGKPAEALEEYQKARDIQQKLAVANPAVTKFHSDLAQSHHNLGVLLANTGKPAEALKEIQKARDIWQKLAVANRSVTSFQIELAGSRKNIASLLSQAGKRAEALKEWQKERDIWQKLADVNPAVTDFQHDLALSHDTIGRLLSEMGKPAESLEEHQKGLAIRQELADAHPTATEHQRSLAWSHHNVGTLQSKLGKAKVALESVQHALKIFQKLAQDNPPADDLQYGLALSTSQLGITQQQAGQTKEAVASFRRAISILEKRPPQSYYLYALCYSQALLATAASKPGSGLTAAEAQAATDNAMKALSRAVAVGYGDIDTLRTETDLAVLRKRSDFQKLLADLEAKAKQP